jgi:hypothetical protein
VAEQAVLDVLRLERFVQERILHEVEHADAEIVAGAPVSIDEALLFGANRCYVRIRWLDYGFGGMIRVHGFLVLNRVNASLMVGCREGRD